MLGVVRSWNTFSWSEAGACATRVMDAVVNAVGKLVFIVLISFFSFEAYSSFQKLSDSKIAVSTSKQFSATRY